MLDREKVSYGLRCMCYGDVECKECPYARNGSGWHDCRSNCAKDALVLLKEQNEEIENLKQTCQSMIEGVCLLKEQEAVEPIPPTDESDLWKCGNCNHQLFRCTHQRYCEMCGKAVKWE